MPNTYKKPFLSQVIFQANYNIPVLKIDVPPRLREICTALTKKEIKEVKNSNININYVPNLPITTELNTKWIFDGEELLITIQHDLIQIVNLKYTNYFDFHKIIAQVFETVRELYDPIITRIALRYVNNIAFPTGGTYDFGNLIDNNLLTGLIKFKDYGLQRSVGQMILKNDQDDINVMFTYGFNNSQFPNKITKREFLLDYDCFCVYSNPTEKITAITDTLLKIRNQVNDLFEKSILDGLRQIMNQNEPA